MNWSLRNEHGSNLHTNEHYLSKSEKKAGKKFSPLVFPVLKYEMHNIQ